MNFLPPVSVAKDPLALAKDTALSPKPDALSAYSPHKCAVGHLS